MAAQAETVARSITDPDWQAQALAAVAGALAGAGQHEQAETVARSITDPDRQAQALAAVAGALAEAGQHEQAATVARSITDPDRQARALMAVAKALVGEGRHETGAPRGLGGVCRRTVDHGAGTGVVAGAIGAKSAHRLVAPRSSRQPPGM